VERYRQSERSGHADRRRLRRCGYGRDRSARLEDRLAACATSTQPSPGRSRSIFPIVDDQPFSRRIVRSILQGFGSREVYESDNSAEALELARTMMPSIIITDIVMPSANGLRLISMLKASDSPTKTIPIVVLSGYLTRSAAMAMTEAGVDEILVKPVAPKSLYEHIAHIVLCNEQANLPAAFAQNRRKHAELQRRKTGDLALI
jgi:two-component system, chemotaxis family, chemotaxis protein CheY